MHTHQTQQMWSAAVPSWLNSPLPAMPHQVHPLVAMTLCMDGVGAGGLYGAGFGIAIDPKENVWVSNFGFQGRQGDSPASMSPYLRQTWLSAFPNSARMAPRFLMTAIPP